MDVKNGLEYFVLLKIEENRNKNYNKDKLFRFENLKLFVMIHL